MSSSSPAESVVTFHNFSLRIRTAIKKAKTLKILTTGKSHPSKEAMPSCKRVAMLWLLSVVLYVLLMPGTSMLTFNKCRYVKNKELISVKGGYNCKQTKVKLGMCVGTCSSYAFPIPIDSELDKPRFQTECQCCAPKETKQRTIRFGSGCDKTIVVEQIRSCECKNCSRRNL